MLHKEEGSRKHTGEWGCKTITNEAESHANLVTAGAQDNHSVKFRQHYCKVPCKRPPPLKHKFLRKVGGGRLLGILPFVQSIIQPLKVQVNTKRLEFKQKSNLFQF